MTSSGPPTIHTAPDEGDAEVIVAELTDPARERVPGLHVVVHVAEGGSVAYGRIESPGELGHGSQRWLRHALRGASPGGWTEMHHPRSEAELGAWREERATRLDRILIDHSKQAWALEHAAPYVVEFAARPLELD